MRLKGYDYSSKGLYFITICVQNREHLFGKVINKKNDFKGYYIPKHPKIWPPQH